MKKVFLLCLVVALLLGTICSCGPRSKPSGGEDTSDKEGNGSDAFVDDGDHGYEVPKIQEANYVFTVGQGARQDFKAELGFELTEAGGDVFAESIIKRNNYVERTCNVTLVPNYYDNSSIVTSQLQAGSCEMDLISVTPVDTASLMLRGFLLDWSKENLPYITPDSPWYLKSMNDELSINGHSYYFAGDFNLSLTRFTYCYFFNQKLLNNKLQMTTEDMYGLVNRHEWTLEKLNEMARDIYEDNGTQGEKDDEDIFGYISNYYSAAVTYNYAFDNRVMIKNEAGYPELNEKFYEKGIDITNAVHNLFFENPGSYVGNWGERDRIWINGNSLFIASIIGDATQYLGCDFTFGVIPYPLYDNTQEQYITMVDGAHGISAIPYNISQKRLSNNSIVIEALNAETRHSVKDVYFEQVLKLRSFTEAAAGEVLDLLLDNRTFDFGYLYSDTSTGFPFLIQTVMSSEYSTEKKEFATLYEENKNSNIDTYTNIIQQLVRLTNQS